MIRMLALSLIAAALAAACQSPHRLPEETGTTRAPVEIASDLPEGRVFVVDPGQSALRIVVYPDGPLARFGHPHVIGGPVIDGRIVVAEPWTRSALELRIDVGAMDIDLPEWRADEGFDPDMDPSAIAGTRDNMLSARVLDADRYPEILIESVGISGPAWQPDMELRITLTGTTRELTVPIALELETDTLIATGRFPLRQSEFGIEPFSAAGGNLQVADLILLRFRIVATPDGSSRSFR